MLYGTHLLNVQGLLSSCVRKKICIPLYPENWLGAAIKVQKLETNRITETADEEIFSFETVGCNCAIKNNLCKI